MQSECGMCGARRAICSVRSSGCDGVNRTCSHRIKYGQTMSKRPRESELSKDLLLGFARQGDFATILKAVDCVPIDNAVLHEIWNECTATMLRKSHDFDKSRAQYLAELKK